MYPHEDLKFRERIMENPRTNYNGLWRLENFDGCYSTELCLFLSLNNMWFVSLWVYLYITSDLNIILMTLLENFGTYLDLSSCYLLCISWAVCGTPRMI